MRLKIEKGVAFDCNIAVANVKRIVGCYMSSKEKFVIINNDGYLWEIDKSDYLSLKECKKRGIY